MVAAAALLSGLAACDKNDNRTAGEQLDSTLANTEQAAREAKAKAAAATQEAKEAINHAGTEIKQGASELKADAADAAAKLEHAAADATITASVSAGLMKDPDLSAVRIDVDTQDGNVTLTGPAPSADAMAKAETIAKSVEGVKTVTNKLEVKN